MKNGERILLGNLKTFKVLPILFLLLGVFANSVMAETCLCGEACSHDFQNNAKKKISRYHQVIIASHLAQIVPVDPLAAYRLIYGWRSTGITTDRGPYIEICGYDGSPFCLAGPMMLGPHGWQREDIPFAVPEDCHAVRVRLRRLPSRRFDSKISGTLWLDDFGLEKKEAGNHVKRAD